MGKNMGKISKILSSEYNQKIFPLLNIQPQMHLKLLQKTSQKTAEATGDLIRNKIYNEITKVSRNLP